MKKLNAARNAPPARITSHADHQIIIPRNVLKAKAVVLSNGPPVLDERAIERAEKALKALSRDFGSWMREGVDQLTAARDALSGEPGSAANRDQVFRSAHDIKGQAETLGFPLAGRMAAALCRLLDHDRPGSSFTPEDMELIGQHVDAIRAVTRESGAVNALAVGERLAQELERAVDARLKV